MVKRASEVTNVERSMATSSSEVSHTQLRNGTRQRVVGRRTQLCLDAPRQEQPVLSIASRCTTPAPPPANALALSPPAHLMKPSRHSPTKYSSSCSSNSTEKAPSSGAQLTSSMGRTASLSCASKNVTPLAFSLQGGQAGGSKSRSETCTSAGERVMPGGHWHAANLATSAGGTPGGHRHAANLATSRRTAGSRGCGGSPHHWALPMPPWRGRAAGS